MRIRTKLLLFLLALVLPPLVAVSYYALRQGRLLGEELAGTAADSSRHAAAQELALMVELIGEDVNDNRQMLELSLAFLAQEAGRVLAAPAPDGATVFSSDAFDAARGLPAGLTPLAGLGVPATADAPSFSRPAGSAGIWPTDDARRLTRLLPTLATLQAKLAGNMLWAYVALPSGLLCTFPGHGRMPAGYDPRERPWYQAALHRGDAAWTILRDASTGRLTATVAAPIPGPDGKLLGVAGIDAPLETLLPESDLSRRWGEGVRALVVRNAPPSGRTEGGAGTGVEVLGSRDFLAATSGWNTPLAPVRLASPDAAALARLAAAIDGGQPEQMELSLEGDRYFAVYKPFPDAPAGLLVLVPSQAVLRQAASAEAAIRTRTQGMLTVVVSFALLAVAGAAGMAYFGARAVTRPVTSLCLAAERLAQGDLAARAPVAGRDELATLAATFNDMAPKLAERLRLKQDMLLAMEVQQNLLPKAPPVLPGLDIAGATSFCDETGGDYFDYLHLTPQGGGICDVVVGDATGHGVAAALFMATGRALLRAGRGGEPGPAALLTLANGLLWQDTMESGRFLTLYYLRLTDGGLAPDGGLTWARAGHDPALLYDPATDAFEELMGPGLPLGVLPDYAYEEQSHSGLAPGQVLAIGTDGIWEARNPAGEMYGKERFRRVLRATARGTAEAIVAAIHQDVAGFQAGAPRDDDITVVVVKALG
ncbi:protein serine/threonine phosphatase with extracellular sensor [Solidesulfovibrio carbinoliphilus subsp. oakridgensis]|uniref:Protein serine/threonine phosphatase with extracellular sensor n=1 Tax=Solidesulfovibrio carbinoliphilus subsp. oakridgensis TaxID=694327 RepID=G7QDD3_9BACT|nr:SpoIIE family protein phosphatase [Solidesulfovibrio carbinoliphilus]EHJ46439.1 protein serine/threonine phosphatase with extracellular sensor [Solidesulfovibrio carbinoliphilus subsp. oakridgensis]